MSNMRDMRREAWLATGMAALCWFGALGVARAACGDGFLETGEACDDGNTVDGDGCSSMCLVEPGYVCEEAGFRLDFEEVLDTGGSGSPPPNFVVVSPTRVRQTVNSAPGVFNTTMPADLAEIVFTLKVTSVGDDDIIGWTIGVDAGELAPSGTPASTDWLYFSWKQSRQFAFGVNRRSGLILSRVTGDASEADMWAGEGGNVTRLAESRSYPLAPGSASGWKDLVAYQVRMRFSPYRLRVWIAEETAPGSGSFGPETLEFDVTPSDVGTTRFPNGRFGFYVHSQADQDYELISPLSGSLCFVDTDGDGVRDRSDRDSDGDGIPDVSEVQGFADDPDADTDVDGVPDWNDPDHVPGGCVPNGDMPPACRSLPAAVDRDGDGIPNHLDLDSDGDGITDAAEVGGIDRDGDGRPDGCGSVDSNGLCDAGGLLGSPPDFDMDGLPDFLDTDSDGDGVNDHDEAFDVDGDGNSDRSASASDRDGDGIDDAFDPDCMDVGMPPGCAESGRPVTWPLDMPRDSDQDGAPDWLQLCRDGYVTGAEACDDGNTDDTDGCSNSCLLGPGGACTSGASCASGLCDPTSMQCVRCIDDASGRGIDSGCTSRQRACNTSVPGHVCEVCVDDAGPGMADDGCPAARPICDTAGSGRPSCVACVVDADCSGGALCVDNQCVACRDDRPGDATDSGCTAHTPLCDDSSVATCRACLDSASGARDLGCTDARPVCGTAAGGSFRCVPCEDTAGGRGVDFGCVDSAPVCDERGDVPRCVECARDSHCTSGQRCATGGFCAPACDDDGDCAGSPGTPLCDTDQGVCVGCRDDSDCPGDTSCGLRQQCVFPDSDGDGVSDDVDLDDDNDGVPDTVEGGGADPSADTDGDGVPDYLDPDAVGCADSDGDGRCDGLPRSMDLDGDGVPNHLDLDADGDGLVDLVEAGGEDADGDGRVDGFQDANADGLDDGLAATPLDVPDTDTDGHADFLDVDADGDGLTDTREAGGSDADGDGRLDGFADADGDGLSDALLGMPLPRPDRDGDGTADVLDVDTDGDGVLDGVEGHAGVESSGDDMDEDGLDDAYDPDCTDAAPCGAVRGVPAAWPDTDEDGLLDVYDHDSDGDGIRDGVECPTGAACPDTDMDGVPDFRDGDSDGDGLDDALEGHDTDLDGEPDVTPVGSDSDMDGLDDAYDPDCTDAAPCGGTVGRPAPVPDLDGDMRPNFQDPDDDEDGRSTATERQDAVDYMGPSDTPSDVDEDGIPNWYDEDSDGDEAPDLLENQGDGDNDDNGILDYLDPMFAPTDADGDGIIDIVECDGIYPPDDSCRDSDGDGVPDYLDSDDDNDGVPTRDEFEAPDPDDGDPDNDHDADDDGVPNHLDLDADGDGIPDLWENGFREADADGDGRVDSPMDADGDGVLAPFDADDSDPDRGIEASPKDTDGTGAPDFLDLDADDDGLVDLVEAGGTDANGDGRLDDDADTDGDGLGALVDPSDGGTPLPVPDTDGDDAADYQDLDSDDDGISDRIEGDDVDHDGRADTDPTGADVNANGIDDAWDPAFMGRVPGRQDTDEDGLPDYRDPDDDGDGVRTPYEAPGGDARDTDGDGVPDYLDPDDDGDERPTREEDADPDGDGDPADARDTDGDGVPDYLDPDAPTNPGYAGGAGCSVHGARHPASLAWLGLLGLALGLLWRRRRR